MKCRTVKNTCVMKKNKIWMAVVLLMALSSCVKPEYHYVDDRFKEWFVDQDKLAFHVQDQNGITQEFDFSAPKTDMLEGNAYFLFVKTDEDLCENIHQEGRVSFYEGRACNLSVTNYYGRNTHFALCFYDVQFDVNVDGEHFTCTTCSDERLIERLYNCSMEMLRSHEVNGVVYNDVLHFRITDQDAITRNTFPTELYYAKHYGPIEYELAGEVRCLRQ